MKGCLAVVGIIFLIFVLLIVGCSGFMIYKGKQYAEELDTAFEGLRSTNETFPYEQPADGLLVADRLPAFLEVRKGAVVPIKEFFNRVSRLEEQGDDMGFFQAIREAMGVVTDIVNAFKEVPKALETGLTAQQMSYDEYLWMTETIHITIVEAAEAGETEAQTILDELEETHQGVEVDIQDDKVSYSRMARRLGQENDGFEPLNLALILQNVDDLTGDVSQVLLDAILVDGFEVKHSNNQIQVEISGDGDKTEDTGSGENDGR